MLNIQSFWASDGDMRRAILGSVAFWPLANRDDGICSWCCDSTNGCYQLEG